jgi:EmrB/QacA subfamily drug resistance transporter
MDPKTAPVTPRAATYHLLPYIVAATFFMEYLDTTLIATSLPQMARSFSVGPNEVSLGMTAYMLTLAVFIPVSGWIADRIGSRTVFGGAVVLFTLASVLCGYSNSVATFTSARVLQGIGGAMMVPVGRMTVVRNTEKSRLIQAISTITWPAIVAPVIGPTLGGFITTYASWRWSFFINIPFGIAALTAILIFVPNQHGEGKRRLDMLGFFMSGAALIGILYGAELASHVESSLLGAAGFEMGGVLVGIAAIWHLRRTRDPLLNLSTLAVPTYAVTVLWGSATRIGIEAVPYLCPLLFQIGWGLSAFHSGLLLLSTAIGNIGMKFFTTRIFRRFGFRAVAVTNTGLVVVFIVACGFLAPATPLFLTLAVLFVYGLSRSLQLSTLATLAYADVTDAQKGPASTLWSVAQQMTIGLGIAFGALCLRAVASFRHDGAGPLSGAYDLVDFRWAFAIAAVLTLISIIGYMALPKDAGRALGGGSAKAKAR